MTLYKKGGEAFVSGTGNDFQNGTDRNYRITDDPRSDIEPSDVKSFMELIIGANPFDVEGDWLELEGQYNYHRGTTSGFELR